MKILIVEDEPKVARMIQTLLESEGYSCLTASDGAAGLQAFEFHQPDLVILDWNMPEMNGIDVCSRIRQSRGQKDPFIMMLTAKGEETDRIVGLSTGADDYVVKPFSPSELVVRVRAVLRRQLRRLDSTEEASIVESPHLRINTALFTVYIRATVEDEFIQLPSKLGTLEFKLLATLAKNTGRVWSRDDLLSTVWEDDFNGVDRIVDTYITRLRTKLKVPGFDRSDQMIKTRVGVGYFFEDTSNAQA